MMFKGDKPSVGFRLIGFRLGCRLLAVLIFVMFGLVLILPLAAFAATDEYSFVVKWGTNGGGDGEFRCPIEIAFDSSGNVYVADSANQRIQKFTPEGAFITKRGGFACPSGVAVDSSDNIFVAEEEDVYVWKLTPDGTVVTKWRYLANGDSWGGVVGAYVAVDSDGNVYVAEGMDVDGGPNYCVTKFTSDGTLITGWGDFVPGGIAIDSSGNVYVTDLLNNRIKKFTSDGVLITEWGSHGSGDGQFDLPRGIAANSDGNVYVADSANQRIQKFTSEGAFITKWGSHGSGDGQFDRPMGVGVDLAGNVYVADSGNDRIQKFSRFASPTTTLWTEPTSPNSNGWFTSPTTIHLNRGTEAGSTYYKWEYQSSFTTYSTPIQAPEGQHTLYYYSKDSANNAELVKSAFIKVDPNAPSVPTNIKAMPMGSSRIDISWNASTDGISGVAGYKLYDADTNSLIDTINATSCSHLGLNDFSTYSYYVKAFDDAGNESGQSATVSATTYREPVPTVPDIDGTCQVNLGNDITLNFDNVTNSGTTSISVEYSAPSPPPGGFSFLDYYWDVSTTASFEDSITITFPYDDTGLTPEQEANLRLFHWEGGAWQDATVLPVDTAGNIITGKVSSLSPFVVGYSSSSEGGSGSGGSSSVPSSSTWSLILMGLIAIGVIRRSLKRETPPLRY